MDYPEGKSVRDKSAGKSGGVRTASNCVSLRIVPVAAVLLRINLSTIPQGIVIPHQEIPDLSGVLDAKVGDIRPGTSPKSLYNPVTPKPKKRNQPQPESASGDATPVSTRSVSGGRLSRKRPARVLSDREDVAVFTDVFHRISGRENEANNGASLFSRKAHEQENVPSHGVRNCQVRYISSLLTSRSVMLILSLYRSDDTDHPIISVITDMYGVMIRRY